jgi:hypothetical protein
MLIVLQPFVNNALNRERKMGNTHSANDSF